MTAQAASATYSLIIYSNAYTSVQGRSEPLNTQQQPRISHVLQEAALLLMRYLTARRLQAQRNAGLRRAAREASRVEQFARQYESSHPAMAQELRAAAAHRMGQFD
jgi:hypothetical protein